MSSKYAEEGTLLLKVAWILGLIGLVVGAITLIIGMAIVMAVIGEIEFRWVVHILDVSLPFMSAWLLAAFVAWLALGISGIALTYVAHRRALRGEPSLALGIIGGALLIMSGGWLGLVGGVLAIIGSVLVSLRH